MYISVYNLLFFKWFLFKDEVTPETNITLTVNYNWKVETWTWAIAEGVSGAEDLPGESRRTLSGMTEMFHILAEGTVRRMYRVDGTSNTHLQTALPHQTAPPRTRTVCPASHRKCWQTCNRSDKSRMPLKDSGKASTFLIKGINITDAAFSPPLTAWNSEIMSRAVATYNNHDGKSKNVRDIVEQLPQNQKHPSRNRKINRDFF